MKNGGITERQNLIVFLFGIPHSGTCMNGEEGGCKRFMVDLDLQGLVGLHEKEGGDSLSKKSMLLRFA